MKKLCFLSIFLSLIYGLTPNANGTTSNNSVNYDETTKLSGDNKIVIADLQNKAGKVEKNTLTISNKDFESTEHYKSNVFATSYLDSHNQDKSAKIYQENKIIMKNVSFKKNIKNEVAIMNVVGNTKYDDVYNETNKIEDQFIGNSIELENISNDNGNILKIANVSFEKLAVDANKVPNNNPDNIAKCEQCLNYFYGTARGNNIFLKAKDTLNVSSIVNANVTKILGNKIKLIGNFDFSTQQEVNIIQNKQKNGGGEDKDNSGVIANSWSKLTEESKENEIYIEDSKIENLRYLVNNRGDFKGEKNKIYIKDSSFTGTKDLVIANYEKYDGSKEDDNEIELVRTNYANPMQINGTIKTSNLKVHGANIEVKDLVGIKNLTLTSRPSYLTKPDDAILKLTSNSDTNLDLNNLDVTLNGDKEAWKQARDIYLIKNKQGKKVEIKAKTANLTTGINDFTGVLKQDANQNYYVSNPFKNPNAKGTLSSKVQIASFLPIFNLSNALNLNNSVKNKISTISKLDSNPNEVGVFAYVDGYKTKYKNTNDIKGQIYTTGIATTNDDITSGLFVQYSDSKYNNQMQKHFFDTKSKIYNIGALARVEFTNIYFEGFAKIGQIQNKHTINFDGLEKSDKKSKQTFYSAAAYIGNNQQISQNIAFDNKFGFSHTKVSKDEFEVNKDTLYLRSIKSNLAEISNTLNFDFDKILAFIGTKFEYEFDATSTIASNLSSYIKEDYKGFSYGGRVGTEFKITKSALISLEGDLLNGKRKEKSAQVGFVYKF